MTKLDKAAKGDSVTSNDLLCVTMYGGPKHGRKYQVPERVCFLREGDGHYARVPGGKKDEVYWHDQKPPIAVLMHGNLRPVLDA